MHALSRLTPRVWGMVWATVLAAPSVLEPFSITGQVPQGSLSDLFALGYEIQWSWLTPRVWLGRAKYIVTSCYK